ncbi:MAG: NHL domain-containing protein [Bacteroidia bacterium]
MKKSLLIIGTACCLNTSAQNYQVGTVAGNGTQGFVDGAATTVCELNYPYGVSYDGDSVIYFTEPYNNAIRKLSFNTNKVSTLVSTGLNTPINLFYKNNLLYVSDNGNNQIKTINVTTNAVTVIAGSGMQGYQDGAAASAMFNAPAGIYVDTLNNIFIADGYNYCIRKINTAGIVSTIAGTPGVSGFVNGTGSSAQFDRPRDLVVSTTGDIFVTDLINNVIRKITTAGVVSTFAGTGVAGAADGGPGVATLNVPVGIAITYNNYIYFIDGQGNKVRKVSPTGMVSTIAGNGAYGFVDGAATSAEFNIPQGITYDTHGNLYVGDRTNNRVRKISVPECGDCAGINQLTSTNEQVTVYPNPTKEIINLELKITNEEPATLQITDMLGNIHSTFIITPAGRQAGSPFQISTADLSEGVYNLSISSNKGVVNKRVIIAR